MGSRWRGGSSLVEQKTYVFELDRLVLSGVQMDGGPFFTQVGCPGGGAGGGGASSASSPSTPGLTRASEKLKQNLESTVMEDGTRFLVGNEFLATAEPYFIVKVRPPGASPMGDKMYKIMLHDLSIQKFFGLSDTTPERFDALQAIVAKFRPRANNNNGRRSSRKQRKSRRTNRKRGSRRRTH